MNGLLYDINDKPPIKALIVYAIQQLLAVFVATVLIANICGTPVSSCLVGAGLATLTYQLVTGFRSPMFISSCGATCSAVIGALAMSNGNYLAVVIGGVVIAAVYLILALIVKTGGIEKFNKLFPPTIVGAITIVIGLNLATFIPTYVQVNGDHSNIGILIAIFTMIVTAISSHYFKGFLKTIPFLIGLAAGYILAAICGVVDWTVFNGVKIFAIPDFATEHFAGFNFDILAVAVLFIPVALASAMEHYSDHKVLSNIIGTDLTTNPGLANTLAGDGLASLVGTIVCGLPNTSYGESIATTGFSRVASVRVLTCAAFMIIFLGFIGPVQAFIASIPSCVFGGCAMILYGYIAASGLKTMKNVDLDDNKNLIVASVVLTVGVSGIWLFNEAFAGVALAMVLGIILNLILVRKEL